jgi:hypothetical protein
MDHFLGQAVKRYDPSDVFPLTKPHCCAFKVHHLSPKARIASDGVGTDRACRITGNRLKL